MAGHFHTTLTVDMAGFVRDMLWASHVWGNSVARPGRPAQIARENIQEAGIHGTVKVGTLPLQGVRVTASNSLTGKQATTTTDANGAYSITLRGGRYLIRAELFGFSPSTTEVLLNSNTSQKGVNFSLQSGANNLSSLWEAVLLPPVSTSSVSLQPAISTIGASSGAQVPSFPGDPNFSGDSFVVDGQASIVNPFFQMDDLMRQSFEDGHQLQGTSVGSDEDLSAGGPVTPSSPNQTHGLVYWNGGNSALNADPFLLAGQSSPNPSYNSNGYGLVLSGHPYILGLTRPSNRDSASFSYAGQIATTLINDYATVPTELERTGNFSQLLGPTGAPILIYPPRSRVPYPNNTIDSALLDPVALALLQYLPAPNLRSTSLNYRLVTPQGTHTNTIGAGYTHSFGASPTASSGNQSVSVNFNLNRVANDVINVFPAFGGKRVVQGYALTAAYSINRQHLFQHHQPYLEPQQRRVAQSLYVWRRCRHRGGRPERRVRSPHQSKSARLWMPNLVLNNSLGSVRHNRTINSRRCSPCQECCLLGARHAHRALWRGYP